MNEQDFEQVVHSWQLTDRQKTIAWLIYAGYSQAEIGQALKVSQQTISLELQRIKQIIHNRVGK